MSVDSITEVFYHQQNINSYQTHCGQWFCLSTRQRELWHMYLVCNLFQTFQLHFSDLWPQQPRCDWWTPLITRFRESYNSMSTSCESTNLKKSSGDCLNLAKHVIQHLSEMMLFLNYCIISGSAEALVGCGGKLKHLLIVYFLGNTCAKHYENSTVLSRVTAKNVGDVFLRHSVQQLNLSCLCYDVQSLHKV